MEAGKVKEIPYEIKQFEWEIPDFFSLCETYVSLESPIFTVADDSWYLGLYSCSVQSVIDFYLNCEDEREYSVEYYLGLRKCDGSIKQFVSGILDKDDDGSGYINLIEKTELLLLKAELAPGNNLTVICTMKPMTEISSSTQPTGLDEIKPLKLIRLDKLSDNFKDLFADKESCDVTFNVKDKEYKAHKSVLIARSSVFAATFKHDTLERQTGVITITDCDPDSFLEFLKYLYCGKLEELSVHNALNLYYTSDKYNVEELKAFCVEYLMQGLKVENVCEVVVFADKYDEKDLFSKAQEFFNENAREIFETSEWECLLKKDYRIANKLLVQMSKVKL